MPRLDGAIRNIAIGRLESGESQNAVATRYNVHRSMVSRFGSATNSQARQMMVHALDVLISQIL
jgi:cellobiose-specific phosphotransferase system component IIA